MIIKMVLVISSEHTGAGIKAKKKKVKAKERETGNHMLSKVFVLVFAFINLGFVIANSIWQPLLSWLLGCPVPSY